MFLESLLGLSGCYIAYRINNKDDIYKRKQRKIIENKWNKLMDAMGGTKIENKMKERFKLLKIIPKNYGFDAIVSLPYGLNCNDFRVLLPAIQQAYQSNSIAEPSNDKNSIYMRCYDVNSKINTKDKIRLKWYTHMSGSKYRNSLGETFTIKSIKELKSPKKETIGYELDIKIPSQLSYDDLKSCEEDFQREFGRCLINFDKIDLKTTATIITNPIGDKEPFVPIKPKTPYDFYLAMNHSYKPIFTNLKDNPHILVTGQSQTGKTISVLTGITNLAYFYNEDDFILYESMISSKQDLRIFKELRQCMYYASDIPNSVKLFRHVLNELNRRNKMFASSEKFCGNMYDWNKMYPKKKLPIIILTIDEMTLYTPKKSDKGSVKSQKEECVDILTQLIIEGASGGINVLFSLQRPDREAFPPMIKSQCGTRIGFYQGNTASSLVAMDDDSCSRLPMKREAVVKYNKGTELVKTLYITHAMIIDLLKDKMIGTDHHLNLDGNGNIIKENKNSNDKKDNVKEEKKDKSENVINFKNINTK